MRTKGFIFFITLCISFMSLCCNSQDSESTNTDLEISYNLNSKEGLTALAGDDELLEKLLGASAGNVSAASRSSEEIRTGDVNCDGNINLVDATLITLYCLYPAKFNFYSNIYNITFDERYADVNRDGVIDLDDALLVLLYWNGEIEIFPGERIIFDDPNLEQAIRQLIGIESGDVYYGDVNYITSVYFSYREITKITALKYFTSLTSIDIYNNQIISLHGLENLTKLISLNINNNIISDISAIINCTSLELLRSNYNSIKDISALKNMTELRTLELRNNQIEAVSVPLNLMSVIYFDLSYNNIQDISSMEFIPELHYINLSNNQIDDITPLVNNPGVGSGDYLGLINNPVTDIPEQQKNIQILWDRGVVVRDR